MEKFSLADALFLLFQDDPFAVMFSRREFVANEVQCNLLQLYRDSCVSYRYSFYIYSLYVICLFCCIDYSWRGLLFFYLITECATYYKAGRKRMLLESGWKTFKIGFGSLRRKVSVMEKQRSIGMIFG